MSITMNCDFCGEIVGMLLTISVGIRQWGACQSCADDINNYIKENVGLMSALDKPQTVEG